MSRKVIIDKNEIEGFFRQGHFDVLMPGGILKKDEDDYDIAIGDYFARINNLGENLDSNGSEAHLKNIEDDGIISVVFFVYDREYERGSWEEKKFITTGKLILDEQFYNGEVPLYAVEQFKEEDNDNEEDNEN
jgi:hypothetical protein